MLHTRTGWWLEEAGEITPQPPLSGGTRADVVVIGGGYLGLWTAWQLRQLEPGFRTAEWGFAIGSAFWGTGVFRTGAELMMHLAFDVIGVHRLEARACVQNVRGNAALQKLGAVQEGVLRRSFMRNGVHHDQVLWGIVAEDWRLQRLSQSPTTTTIN